MNGLEGKVESQLAGAQDVQRWPAGSILFNEGDDPPGIFIVHTGLVDLLFSRSGISKVLRTARNGEVLGLSEIVSGSTCDCTATARTASRIGFVPGTDLQRMLDENPSLWLEIAEGLSVGLGSCWRSLRSVGAR